MAALGADDLAGAWQAALKPAASDYGAGRLRAMHLAGRRAYVAVDAEAAACVLVRDRAAFGRSAPVDLVRSLLTSSALLMLDGADALTERAVAQPAFTPARLARVVDVASRHADATARAWAVGEPLDIHHQFAVLAAAVVAEALTGRAANGTWPQRIATTLDTASQRFAAIAGQPNQATQALHDSKAAVQQLVAELAATAVLTERAVPTERAGVHVDAGDRSGSLTGLLAFPGPAAAHDERLASFVVPAVENITLALTWTAWAVAHDPHAERVVADEVAAVLGGRPLGAADFDDLQQLERAVREALRLWPPVPFIGRTVVSSVNVGGQRLDVGDIVLVSPWAAHRDRRFFEGPEQFRPQRWADGLALRLPAGAYVPFGAGPRRCIGRTMATTVSVSVLATCYQRFRLVPAHEHGDVAVEPWLSLRPSSGVWMRPEPAPRH